MGATKRVLRWRILGVLGRKLKPSSENRYPKSKMIANGLRNTVHGSRITDHGLRLNEGVRRAELETELLEFGEGRSFQQDNDGSAAAAAADTGAVEAFVGTELSDGGNHGVCFRTTEPHARVTFLGLETEFA